MKTKLKLLISFLLISSFSFSQTSLEQKDSIAKNLTQIGGKAIVYVLRPSSFGALIRQDINCDNVFVGSTKSRQYVYTVLDSGVHTFTSSSENVATLDVTLEAGKVYYIKQQVKMGVLYAETGLKLLDENEGKKYSEKCKLSKTNVYSK